LKPLNISNTENIIKSVTGAAHLPERLGKLIHEHTNGNPLFIEEVCYSLIEEGVIVVNGEEATLTQSLSKLSLPDTVQAIIRTRLDRLNNNTKEAIRLASVIGRVFGQRILEELYSVQFELSKSLEELKTAEVIQQTRILPEAEFTFRHVMTQAVVYETLLLQRRKEIHGAIGQAIEELYSERLDEQLPILAHHYIRSNRHDKAIEYALLAGDQAAGLFANKEATAFYEQAFAISQACPESSRTKKWQINAALKLASVGITRQDIERDLKNLEQVSGLAEKLNDQHSLARIFYWLGRIQYVLWSPQAAMQYAKKSLLIAESLKDEVLAAPPVNLMGRVYYQLSDFNKAIQFLERSVEQMRTIGNSAEECTASALSGYVLAFLGEFDRAFIHANHSIQLSKKIQNPFAQANAYHLRGCICDQQGEWTKAIKDYEKAIHIAETADDLFRIYLVKSWMGRAQAMIGEFSWGKELLEESLSLAEKIGTKFWLAWQKTALAACLFLLGELETGSQLCQEAICIGEETSDKYVVAFAKRTFAEILYSLKPADPEVADRAILEAIRIQQEIDAKPEMARSYVSYAYLLTGMGKEEKAKKYLATAIDMFQQMGMTWDSAQTNH
jgi:predicted ATPase